MYYYFFSFGQSCIFLIGGPTKETEPVPLFLHSGDICLMTGEARLSYHAVPRIYPSDNLYFHDCFHDKGNDPHDQSVISNSHTHDSVQPTDSFKLNNDMKTVENIRTSSSGILKDYENESDSDTEDDPYNKSDRRKIFIENMVKLANDCEDEKIVETETVKGNKCDKAELSELIDNVVNNTDWEPFEQYVAQSRINLNVRQVLKPGLSLGTSPSVIVPCQGK